MILIKTARNIGTRLEIRCVYVLHTTVTTCMLCMHFKGIEFSLYIAPLFQKVSHHDQEYCFHKASAQYRQ